MGLIYLDACILIYAVERDEAFGERVRAALGSVTQARFAISPLVQLECLVKPLREGDLALQHYYEAAFGALVQLGLPEPVYVSAAQLRARFGLRTPDALHLACAQHHRCDALWTNDDRLAHASHGLALNVTGKARRSGRTPRR